MTPFKIYLKEIARANGLSGDVEWLFYPGMLQDSPAKWWDDWKFRHAIHEGIDICFFRTRTPPRAVQILGPGAAVPALSDGILRNICPDFLGHSLIVEPSGFDHLPQRVIWVFSHQTPAPEMEIGCPVKSGQIISRIFDTRTKGSKLLSHLHISCMKVDRNLPFCDMNWSLFPRRNAVNLINPISL